MMRRESGFTLVELMITMVVFVLVIAAGSQIFTGLLTQFKQQSKIAETNIEGIIGLEILRQDIEHAGYGLPWVIPSGVSYSEASAGYNDSPSNPPRAILSGNGSGFNTSDELIIKAINVARNATAQKWTHLRVGNITKTWDIAEENFVNDDRVIVLFPGTTHANRRTLVVSTDFYTTFNNTAAFAPPDETETRFVYGINNPANTPPPPPPRMPFNRADYYISTSNVPDRCAEPGTGTGVLSKNVISHANGSRADNLPLLDCVADMQVVFRIDNNNDGTIDFETDNLATLTDTNGNGIIDAQEIREQVREVRIYILAHEGQIDRNYTFNNFTVGACATCVRVGEFGMGRDFNLATITPGNTDYLNYRWKVYTLVVKPNNLR